MNCHHNSIDFPDRELWTDHIGSEHGLAPDWPNQECPLCLKETGSGKGSVVAHLTTHMEDIALAALPYVEVNSENIHFGTSPLSQHPCQYPDCSRTFTGTSRKGNMSRHMRTKHGASIRVAREYPCESVGCGKRFRRNDAKLNHERKEHPELGRMSAVLKKLLDSKLRAGDDL